MSWIYDLNDHKLETTFDSPSCVVHTSYKADRARGIHKVTVTERWVREKKLLGVGTFGTVRLERCQKSDEDTGEMRRAVKQMHKAHLERLKIDYKKELMALTKFSKSKFSQSQLFVEFLGWFEDDENVFIAMEYFDLGTLEKYIPTQIQENEAQSIALQLLEGLIIMHEEGFTHRDLKPENIFVVQKSPSWWVKIGDFGITKRVSNNDTALQTATGGEDDESGTYTNAVDVWSFACVIYQIMALQVPFVVYPRSLLTFCNDGPFPIGPLQKRTSQEGIDFIKSVLVAHPEQRPTAQHAIQAKWVQDGETSGEDVAPAVARIKARVAELIADNTVKAPAVTSIRNSLDQGTINDYKKCSTVQSVFDFQIEPPEPPPGMYFFPYTPPFWGFDSDFQRDLAPRLPPRNNEFNHEDWGEWQRTHKDNLEIGHHFQNEPLRLTQDRRIVANKNPRASSQRGKQSVIPNLNKDGHRSGPDPGFTNREPENDKKKKTSLLAGLKAAKDLGQISWEVWKTMESPGRGNAQAKNNESTTTGRIKTLPGITILGDSSQAREIPATPKREVPDGSSTPNGSKSGIKTLPGITILGDSTPARERPSIPRKEASNGSNTSRASKSDPRTLPGITILD